MFQFRRFPTYAYLIQRRLTEYCSAGFPHSVILGYNAHVQLPQAYRSLSRPSSAPDAKAFPLRSYQLDLMRGPCPRHSPISIIGSRLNHAGFRVCLKCFTTSQLVVAFTHSSKTFLFQIKVSTNTCSTLLLALHHGISSHCSVFKVQLPAFKARFQCPIAWTLKSKLNCPVWWAKVDSNHRPHDYQSCALAS